MGSTIADMVAVDPLGSNPDEFVSRHRPIHIGNTKKIAFGGFTMAVAIHAAAKTVPPGFHLYSVLGHFLGGASVEDQVRCRVTRIRDTRTFSTRRVQLLQPLPPDQQPPPPPSPEEEDDDDNDHDAHDHHRHHHRHHPKRHHHELKERVCLELTADFQVEEPAFMSYSSPPARYGYSRPQKCPTRAEVEMWLSRHLDPSHVAQFRPIFDVEAHYFDVRLVPESTSAQTLNGAARDLGHNQELDPITSRTSAEWYRLQPPSHFSPVHGGGQAEINPAETAAAAAFIMDEGLAFTPLVHDHKVLTDASAVSSLDFALRFIQPKVDLRRWHLKERVTHAAAAGRNFSECRMWDEAGNMVASMSQQSIMRPPPPPPPSVMGRKSLL